MTEDGLRLVPGLEGHEHIRAHEEPKLIAGVLSLQLRDGIGGKALAAPADLHIQNLHPVPQAQLLGGKAGHLQALLT